MAPSVPGSTELSWDSWFSFITSNYSPRRLRDKPKPKAEAPTFLKRCFIASSIREQRVEKQYKLTSGCWYDLPWGRYEPFLGDRMGSYGFYTWVDNKTCSQKSETEAFLVGALFGVDYFKDLELTWVILHSDSADIYLMGTGTSTLYGYILWLLCVLFSIKFLTEILTSRFVPLFKESVVHP